MSRKIYVGDAAQLLASARTSSTINNNNNNNNARASSNPRGVSTGRSASSLTGGPTLSSYASRSNNNTPVTSNNNGGGRQTPLPNRNGPPQPTPRTTSDNNNNRRTTSSNNNNGLVSTPAASSSTTRRPGQLLPPSSNNKNNNNNNSILSNTNNQQQQQQQNNFFPPQESTTIAGQKIAIFPRDLAERTGADFKTSEARASLRMTVETERQLQELVKARRDRALEMLQMFRNESSEWQSRIDGVKAKLQREESRRIDLAAQAREVETEALNSRHQLRQSQNLARKKGEAALLAAARSGYGGGGGSESDEFGGGGKPHSIIQQVLQRFAKADGHESTGLDNGGGGGDGYDSGDDAVYAAVLGKDMTEESYQNESSSSSAWFTNNQSKKKKRPRLTKSERIQAAGKIAVELEKSLRTTRMSLESRAAELEASLSEIASLENQKIGFGVTVEEMREKVRAVHNSVKQASWMRSCLPLLEQTVRQREALADQGEEYGKKVIASLMALNKRDDEFCSILQEKVERNLLKPDDVVRTAQEQNQLMSRELGDAVRDAETWRAQMNATCEKYQAQLREVERSIDEASKNRRSSIF